MSDIKAILRWINLCSAASSHELYLTVGSCKYIPGGAFYLTDKNKKSFIYKDFDEVSCALSQVKTTGSLDGVQGYQDVDLIGSGLHEPELPKFYKEIVDDLMVIHPEHNRKALEATAWSMVAEEQERGMRDGQLIKEALMRSKNEKYKKITPIVS